jgi:L-alanine-DL-glutamate epimerase-like enolase superfamily enzyme
MVEGTAGLAGLASLPSGAAGKSERLKITKVEIFQVVVPMQDDIINSPEFNPDVLSEFPKLPKVIIKLHTDSGLVGIGETPRELPNAHRFGPRGYRRKEDLSPGYLGQGALENARHLEGQNVLDLNLPRLVLPDDMTRHAFEIALYDVVGKAFGWPVYQLLGGLAQDKIYVPYWCGRKNPVDAKRVAERALKDGFTSLKMKGRPGDPIVDAVRAVQEVAPDLEINVDFNHYFETAEEFLPTGRALDEIGNMHTIEDPVGDLGELTKITEALDTAITTTAWSREHLVEAARMGACDWINIRAQWPSLMSFVIEAAVAETFGMPCWHGSSHDLGIKDAAFIQAAAAAANCTLPCDIMSHQRVHDLLVEPINIKDSYVIVPHSPGLGVELDEDAVEKYSV